MDRLTVPDGYEPLEATTVEAYLDSRPALRARLPAGLLTVREVGDGNLNLVFIVRSAAEPDVPGIVLKQSLPWVRVFGEGWPLTVERLVAVRDGQSIHTRSWLSGSSIGDEMNSTCGGVSNWPPWGVLAGMTQTSPCLTGRVTPPTVTEPLPSST